MQKLCEQHEVHLFHNLEQTQKCRDHNGENQPHLLGLLKHAPQRESGIYDRHRGLSRCSQCGAMPSLSMYSISLEAGCLQRVSEPERSNEEVAS
jgi:hypothetical protein